ncbi:hypothetical protein ACTFIT_002448 [Dictyostelium discoideum]
MKIKFFRYVLTIDEQSEENKKEVAIDQQVVNDTNSDISSNRDSLNIEDEQQKESSSSLSSSSNNTTTTTATTTSPTTTATTTTTTATTSTTDESETTNSTTPTSATSTPDSMITPTKSKGSSNKLNSKEDKNLKKQKQKEEKERLEMEKQKQKEEKEQKIKDEKERLEMEKQKQKEEKEQKIKDEKERLEMEKQKQKEEKEKLKEEKEKSKREQKEKEKEKEDITEQKDKDSTPTKVQLTREPSVISKIFSVKKSNSLIIERSTSPVQIDSSPSKSFIESNNNNNSSSNNLANNTTDRNSISSEDANIIQNNTTDSNIENNETTNNNNNSNGSRTSTPTPINSEGIEKSISSSDLSNITTTTTTTGSGGLNTSPSTENINVGGGTDSGTTTTTTNNNNNNSTNNLVGDKTELSSGSSVISSPNGGTKREVVIKVTRAFAQVIHQNVMKEEGENKMRNMVINEIINTEKDYIADLNIIVNFILTPLKESKIIPDKDISIIFSNIQLLLNVNKELLSDLLQKAPDEKPNHTVGTCFIYFFKYLKIYSGYCANQTISADHIARCSKKIPSFKQFLEEKQASTECRQCNLESFLIKPVQRLCKYPLLLRELIKNSCEGHPDLANLEKAYTEIQEVVLSVNESKRKAEIHQKMYKIHEKLQAPEKFVFFTPTRYLIREATFGELTEEKDKISGRMHYYLFNDIIMRTQKDKKSIRLETLFIIASTNVDGEENRGSSFCNTFEISQPGTTGRRFTLVADSYEQKMEWFTDLDELIKPHREEYSRNADKVLDHIKRSTIATTNPSSNGISSDSPKSLHRTQTAAGALQQQQQQSKPVHAIPSKPLPPPPPKSKSSATITPTTTTTNTTVVIDEPPTIVDSASTPLPSQTPIAKPRPTSTIKKTFITNSNQTSSPQQQQPATTEQAPPIPSRQQRPLSVTPTTTPTPSQPVITQQNENNNTVPTKTTRPLPKPGSFTAPAPVSTLINNNNTSNSSTTTTTTTTTNQPAKPIAFPSKLSNLKQAAPNNSARSASTFVPSTSHSSFVPSSVKNNTNNNNITKDDLSLPSSANNNNNNSNTDFTTPPTGKPRVMPLPPRGGSAVNVAVNNNNNINNNSPVPLPTTNTTTPTATPPHSPQTSDLNLTKKPIIPPRK